MSLALLTVAILSLPLKDFNLTTTNKNKLASPQLRPIVEIEPFTVLRGAIGAHIKDGIRHQLIVGLAHFRSIRVRSVSFPNDDNPKRRNDWPSASYRIKGTFESFGETRNWHIVLIDVKSNTVRWARTIRLPKNDAEFQELRFQAVRLVASNLASISGLMQSDAINHLKERISVLSNPNTSDYECVLQFYEYDLTKSKKYENLARDCLAQLTQADSQDAAVWASWSLISFLDSTKASGKERQTLLNRALYSSYKAINLDPQDATPYEYLGSIMMSTGRPERALEFYQTAMKLNPSKPTLHVLFGWLKALGGDWERGITEIQEGISMSLASPGWVRIPLSINAFRVGNYSKALSEAETIILSGDNRGIPLALAAAIGSKDADLIDKYTKQFNADLELDPNDPMKQIKGVFDNTEILSKYNKLLAIELSS